jgi:hypothetical protein
MSICGFGQIPDLRCKSLCCYGRIILDRKCNLSVANANIDSVLSVDVGGTVNFPFTSINLKNSAIDFTGSAITGFNGEISGNLTIQELEVIGNLTTPTLYANVIFANIFKGTLKGSVIGDVCGNIVTNKISSKNGGNITIDGALLFANTVGTFVGNSVGTHCGPVQTAAISEKVSGEGIIFTGNMLGTHVGPVCGNLFTNTIEEKSPGSGINFVGDVTMGNLTVEQFIGDLSGTFNGNIITSLISAQTISGITIVGLVTIGSGINVGPITGTSIDIELISPVVGFTIDVSGSLNITGANIMVANVITDKLYGKTNGNISVCGNLITTDYIIADDVIIKKNLTIVGNINTNLANLVVANFIGNLYGDVCGNVKTWKLQEKAPFTGINVFGTLNLNGDMVASLVTATNLTLTSVPSGGRVLISDPSTSAITSDSDFTYNSTTNILNTTGGYAIGGTTILDGLLISGRVPFITTGGLITSESDFTYNSTTNILNTTGGYAIGGTTILDGLLISGRVPFITTGGLITSESDFTYNTGTNTLTVNDGAFDATGTSTYKIDGTTVMGPSTIADTSVVFSSMGLLTGDSGFYFDQTPSSDTVHVGALYANTLGLAIPVTETAATHVVATTTSSLICNRTTTITVTLPDPATFSGRILYIKQINASAGTVISNASNVVPLNGGAAGTAILAATQGKFAMLQSDGTNWIIMMAN